MSRDTDIYTTPPGGPAPREPAIYLHYPATYTLCHNLTPTKRPAEMQLIEVPRDSIRKPRPPAWGLVCRLAGWVRPRLRKNPAVAPPPIL